MKKQISSVTIMSAKFKISLTIICALFGAAEVNANNYSSFTSHSVSKEVRPENKVEMNRNSTLWVVKNSEEEVEVKTIDVIEQWIADGSYWSADDSLSNELKVSENNVKIATDTRIKGIQGDEMKPFIFNAESFIQNSEF